MEGLEMDNNLRIEQFTKFYDALMSNAPKGYKPWLFPCEKQGKNPAPLAIMKIDRMSRGSWHHAAAQLTREQCINHILEGWNIGISARVDDALVIGDIDEKEYLDQCPKNTLTTQSRKRCGCHFFGWNKDNTAKINMPTGAGEMRSINQYVLAPGSYVPFDLTSEKEQAAYDKLSEEAKNDAMLGYYTVQNAVSPKGMSFEDLPEFFKEAYTKEKEAQERLAIINRDKPKAKFKGKGKYSELFNLTMIDLVGSLPSNRRLGHPLHESDTDANFSLSSDGSICFCWRHMVSLNPVQFLCVDAGYAECQDAGTPFKIRGQSMGVSKLKGDKKAFEVAYTEAVKRGLISEYAEPKKKQIGDWTKKIVSILKISELAKEFGVDKCPECGKSILYTDDKGWYACEDRGCSFKGGIVKFCERFSGW